MKTKNFLFLLFFVATFAACKRDYIQPAQSCNNTNNGNVVSGGGNQPNSQSVSVNRTVYDVMINQSSVMSAEQAVDWNVRLLENPTTGYGDLFFQSDGANDPNGKGAYATGLQDFPYTYIDGTGWRQFPSFSGTLYIVGSQFFYMWLLEDTLTSNYRTTYFEDQGYNFIMQERDSVGENHPYARIIASNDLAGGRSGRIESQTNSTERFFGSKSDVFFFDSQGHLYIKSDPAEKERICSRFNNNKLIINEKGKLTGFVPISQKKN